MIMKTLMLFLCISVNFNLCAKQIDQQTIPDSTDIPHTLYSLPKYFCNDIQVDSVTYFNALKNQIEYYKTKFPTGDTVTYYNETYEKNITAVITGYTNEGLLLDADGKILTLTVKNPDLKLRIEKPFEIKPGYRELKKVFASQNYRYKSSDAFYPPLIAISSIFIPGLGQMICGDFSNGLLFLSGYALSYVSIFASLILNWNDTTPEGNLFYNIGVAGVISFPVIASIHSLKLVKYKNLYLREKSEFEKVNLSLQPCMLVRPPESHHAYRTAGISLKISF